MKEERVGKDLFTAYSFSYDTLGRITSTTNQDVQKEKKKEKGTGVVLGFVSATFFGLPLAKSRWENALIAGL